MKFYLLIGLFLVTFSIYGQTRWEYGPAIGAGISDLVRNNYSGNNLYSPLVGYHIGLETNKKVSKHLILRGQLRFASVGSTLEKYSLYNNYQGTDKRRLHYLELPVHLAIDFSKSDGFILIPGINFGFGIGGIQKLESSNGEKVDRQIKFSTVGSSSINGLVYNPYNISWALGIGYKKDNVLFDIIMARSLKEDGNNPLIITLKGGVTVMINTRKIK